MPIRLGLCCQFSREPIRFRATTVRDLLKLPRTIQLERLAAICLDNCRALIRALEFCQANGIGAFRIPSPFFPRCTHPEVGYWLDDLPDRQAAISALLAEAKGLAGRAGIRLSLHPDQFIVLSSPEPRVVANAGRELGYQARLAELVGADTITLHAGGAYGDKAAALRRWADNFRHLPPAVQSRLALENDDRLYSVADLLTLCGDLAIPLAYDVHHHRCHPDQLTVSAATELTAATWQHLGREPYCHISSPKSGWGVADPRPHADYIDPADFPSAWQGLTMTLDVEAKAKELAVLALGRSLAGMGE